MRDDREFGALSALPLNPDSRIGFKHL